jgi:hypothetical protein
MNSTIFILLVVFTIFGSAGVMFLKQASKESMQQSDSKFGAVFNTFNVGVKLIVGGWFILVVLIGICLTITRLLPQ